MRKISNSAVQRLFSISLIAVMNGCGQGGVNVTNLATTINGNAILGEVSSGTVTAYPILTSGALDTAHPLASTKTDSSGNYQLLFATKSVPSGPVGIQLTGGSYEEESTGKTVSMTGSTLSALLPTVNAGKVSTAAIGPLTEMAFQSFQSQASLPSPLPLAQLAVNSNYSVSQAFGLTDIVGTLPSNPKTSITNDAAGQYAVVMLALSVAANTAGTDTVGLSKAYAAGFVKNGNFASPTPISVTDTTGKKVTVSPPTLGTLGASATSIASGSTTGLTTKTAPLPINLVPPTLNSAPPKVAPSSAPGVVQTAVKTLVYPSPALVTVKGASLSLFKPTSTGGVILSCSSLPVLPSGLVFGTDCAISGTPTAIKAAANYTIRAANSEGSVDATLLIVVNGVTYGQNLNSFVMNRSITALSPISIGNIVSYSISPALPVGLSMNVTTGVISGTPTAVSSAKVYTVTGVGNSSSATTTASLSIAVTSN